MLKKASKVKLSIPYLAQSAKHICKIEGCFDEDLIRSDDEKEEDERLEVKMKKIMKIASPIKEPSFNFNVSQLDSVLYMGKVFAVLCPKKSISSKFRGYEIDKIKKS